MRNLKVTYSLKPRVKVINEMGISVVNVRDLNGDSEDKER